MPKKRKPAKDAAESLLKKAQKRTEALVAAARDAAEAAKKSAKKAKKSAKKSGGTSAPAAESSDSTAVDAKPGADGPAASGRSAATEVPPSVEAVPAAENLPLPTADDPEVPSMAWTVARLRATAKERGLTGYGALRKEQLVAALTDAG